MPVNVNAMPACITKTRKSHRENKIHASVVASPTHHKYADLKMRKVATVNLKHVSKNVCQKKASNTPTGRDPPTHLQGKKSVENDRIEQDKIKLFKVGQVAP